MSGKLPHSQTEMADWTDDELSAMVEFRESELKSEWCATLILQNLALLRKEQERRALLKAVTGQPALLGVRIVGAP